MSSDESEMEHEGEMELDEPEDEVGENEPLEEGLVGHESNLEEKDSKMQDFDSDSEDEDDDFSDPDYDPFRDR